MKKNEIVYQLDYVYTPESTGEFRNLKIALEMDKDALVLKIQGDEVISPEDMPTILDSLQQQYFSKLKINIFSDCTIFYAVGNENYNILMDGQRVNIKHIGG